MDKKYHFFLWTKKKCPFCIKAVDNLFDEDHAYTEYQMDDDPTALQQVKDKLNWKTVPMVLVQCSDGETKFIGGNDDLEDFLDCLGFQRREGFKDEDSDWDDFDSWDED